MGEALNDWRLTAFAISAVLYLSAAPTMAAGIYFYDGNEMWRFCSAASTSTDRAFCIAYVAGINDRDAVGAATYCASPGTQISQLTDVFTNFLRDHPEKRQQEAGVLVLLSLQSAWPCS